MHGRRRTSCNRDLPGIPWEVVEAVVADARLQPQASTRSAGMKQMNEGDVHLSSHAGRQNLHRKVGS